MPKYFKKLNPKNGVVLHTGKKLLFETLDDLTGFHKTDDERTIAHFKKCVEENRYGICEISEEEYNRDFVEKKRSGVNLKPTWQRETFGGKSKKTNPLQILGSAAVVAAISTVNEKSDLRMEGSASFLRSGEQPKAPETQPIPANLGTRAPRT